MRTASFCWRSRLPLASRRRWIVPLPAFAARAIDLIRPGRLRASCRQQSSSARPTGVVAGVRRSAIGRPGPAAHPHRELPERRHGDAGAERVNPNDPATYKPRTQFDNTPWRFNMSQNGKNMTADEFSAWMKSRGVRVARGAECAGAGCGAAVAGSPAAKPGSAPAAGQRQPPAPARDTASDVFPPKPRRLTMHAVSGCAPQPSPHVIPDVHRARHGLARILSKRGICSRTEAARWIAAGRVSVAGKVMRDPDIRPPLGRDRHRWHGARGAPIAST